MNLITEQLPAQINHGVTEILEEVTGSISATLDAFVSEHRGSPVPVE